jgi:hypothetical protein
MSFVRAGYEVHLNFSPVIVYDGWERDYQRLFEQVDDALSPAAKEQLRAEIIFLTHNKQLHEVNMQWHPKAEDYLWTPETQQVKRSEGGCGTCATKVAWKQQWLARFQDLLRQQLPYCGVRYASDLPCSRQQPLSGEPHPEPDARSLSGDSPQGTWPRRAAAQKRTQALAAKTGSRYPSGSRMAHGRASLSERRSGSTLWSSRQTG